MRTLDRLSIYALSFAIVALVIALLMQKSRKTGDTGEIAPNDFVSRISRQNEEKFKQLKERQIDKASERLGK